MPGEPIGGPVPLDEVALGGEPMGGPVPLDEVALGGEPLGSSFADEVPTLPQHSGFGSVWDSQIGVSPRAASGSADVEGLEDEPEVPEYLLAEKRQQGRRRPAVARVAAPAAAPGRLPHRDRSRALRGRRFRRLRLPGSGSQPGRWRSTTLVRPAGVSAGVAAAVPTGPPRDERRAVERGPARCPGAAARGGDAAPERLVGDARQQPAAGDVGPERLLERCLAPASADL